MIMTRGDGFHTSIIQGTVISINYHRWNNNCLSSRMRYQYMNEIARGLKLGYYKRVKL